MSKKNSNKEKKYNKEDIKITIMLLFCLVTVMVCSLSLISIYEKKSLLDIFQEVKSEATAMFNTSDGLVRLQDEMIPAAFRPDDQPELDAKKNNYNWGNLYSKDLFRYYYDGDKLESKMGIDVSYYQGKINWKKVKQAGIDFAIIRLGYRGYKNGELMMDTCYKYNIENAIKEGIDVGVYFFTQALTEQEAIEEANYCIKNVEDYKLEYPIVIDTEAIDDRNARSHIKELSKEQLTKICKAFCDTVKKSDYDASIYASKSWFLDKLDIEKLDSCNKWLAHYTKVTDYKYDFGIWQYTSDGKVDGIKGRVDLNISL